MLQNVWLCMENAHLAFIRPYTGALHTGKRSEYVRNRLLYNFSMNFISERGTQRKFENKWRI